MDELWKWLANLLPKGLVYWCGIRIAAHATMGPHQNQVLPELTIVTALRRWEYE